MSASSMEKSDNFTGGAHRAQTIVGFHSLRAAAFTAAGKAITLYPAQRSGAPLIILNNFTGNASGVTKAMEQIGCADCNLASIGGLNWDADMTPWYCPPLSENDTPCTGGADTYLTLLLEEILPQILERLDGAPTFFGIAGYSLAGLFALYALYQTDRFARCASMSGSLWFPDFVAYAQTHTLKRMPDKLYLSLGDREDKTSNPVLKAVGQNTVTLAQYYRSLGIDTQYEQNPGNHYKDAALRSAKGIAALLE